MKAILVEREKNTSRLVIGEVDEPIVHPNDVLIAIKATALNRADLLQRRGLYPPPAGVPDILGLECAGIILSVGSNVTQWSPGQRVCALLPGCGYAEKVVVHETMIIPIPENLSFAQAAAIPEAWFTAYLNLVPIAQLKAGEVTLIHSGASGVGTAAIQLAKNLDAKIIASVGDSEKMRFCYELGADFVFDYHSKDFWNLIKTRSGGVDIILDTVGGENMSHHVDIANNKARIVVIGLLGGTSSNLPTGTLLTKNISIIGSTLRNKSHEEKSDLTKSIRELIMPHFTSGLFRPIIDSEYSWFDAEAAHMRMKSNLNIGKIILRIGA